MAVPLALPLAPVVVSSGPAATAAAATFFIGSTLHLADTLYGFRRNAPTLPPLTGLDGVATLREMVADALAGARVPVGFPLPPPWRPEGSALGLAATSLGLWGLLREGASQLWGWLNSRPASAVFAPLFPSALPTTGTVPPPGNTVPAQLRYRYSDYRATSVLRPDCTDPQVSVQLLPVDNLLNNVTQVTGPFGDPTGCGYSLVYYRITFVSGSTQKLGLTASVNRAWIDWTAGWDFEWMHPSAVPFENPTEGAPLPSGFVLPQVEPSTTPAAEPVPLPLPAPAPLPQVVPEVQPEVAPVEPGPTRSAPPVVLPAPKPLPLPGADPSRVTVQNGALPAAGPLPVPTTDPGSIIPWPGAAPIPGTGPAPAPTLQGIAQEVGRIERKIEVMMSPNAPGNLIDKFDLLQDLIRPIVELILAAQSGTTYTLDSPCEVDAEGNRLPATEVEAPGALTQFGAILNRIDALAELLQVHKDLKQPNCRGADVPVGGEFVTVNFEQID